MLRSLILIVLITQSTWAQSRPISEPPAGYEHDRFVTLPQDHMRKFAAFTVSFDGPDGDWVAGIPDWVAYELRKAPETMPVASDANKRYWQTDRVLAKSKIAPYSSAYRNSGYSLGHMCMRQHAQRISTQADLNTHTVLNACPQYQAFNAGVWLQLEYACGKWADTYEKIWIITGPILYENGFTMTFNRKKSIYVTVPNAFFKIIVREHGDSIKTLAFIIPHDRRLNTQDFDLTVFATSIDMIERFTGLDFLSKLDDEVEQEIEMVVNQVWD